MFNLKRIATALGLIVATQGNPVALNEIRATKATSLVKIMPFGASIVGAPGCWRAILWQKLQAAGIKNTDFVGSNPSPDCGFKYDGENEGHAGARATEYAQKGNLTVWLKAAKPDIVMVHVGTNDVLGGIKPWDILRAYSTLVDEMRASKVNMGIIFSKLIPLDPSRFSKQAVQGIVDLNGNMSEWVMTKSTPLSPILIVDSYTGFDVKKDTSDGEHPNASGNEKLAQKFYQPLVDMIRNVGS
ncbi:SGNH hydrolase [Lojkania enalia]|uniref:SGNH hydrolase n=1 Tax=Lojkania enalia TaxID=147567 RepID=A0A9P4KAN4_9PLEO|nr:SGNH hydrolase [Didymosphaeria enalia]